MIGDIQKKNVFKSQLSWNVVIRAENLDSKGLMLQRATIIQLMNDFSIKKLVIRAWLFPCCDNYRPNRTVWVDGRKCILVSTKIGWFRVRPRENPILGNEKSIKLEKGMLAEKYNEAEKDF